VLLHSAIRVKLETKPGTFLVDTSAFFATSIKLNSRQDISIATVIEVIVVEFDIPSVAMFVVFQVVEESLCCTKDFPVSVAAARSASEGSKAFLLGLECRGSRNSREQDLAQIRGSSMSACVCVAVELRLALVICTVVPAAGFVTDISI
jgi:hypothetical protein